MTSAPASAALWLLWVQYAVVQNTYRLLGACTSKPCSSCTFGVLVVHMCHFSARFLQGKSSIVSAFMLFRQRIFGFESKSRVVGVCLRVDVACIEESAMLFHAVFSK